MSAVAKGSALREAAPNAVLGLLVVSIVGMMIIPLPTVLLDVLLASNISLSVVVLLVALYSREALAFGAFPTLLLLTTLYRLALNVSSTRLILLRADAGEVIRAFGEFVVQGDYVVGAVVFLILTLIQFIVVAKGSERVAEVGARFTLDAMPGKQMSIDAELRSGALTHEEAKQRRRALQRESQFYGAMDGAMKFVKGDAIAGIVITIINVLGGLAIGVLSRGLDAVTSLETYGLLTIGDGLVSQIPSLLVSTAAGIVVTRVAAAEEGDTLGTEIAGQILAEPRALGVGAVLLIGLAVVPGLPTLPFLALATLLGGTAWQRRRRTAAMSAGDPLDAPNLGAAGTTSKAEHLRAAPAPLVPLVVPATVELGESLAAELGAGDATFTTECVPELRTELFLETGLTLPDVRVRRASRLGPREYLVSLNEIPIGRGVLPAGHVLVIASPESLTALGVAAEATRDPVFGSPVASVPAAQLPQLTERGIPAFDPGRAIARHIAFGFRRRAADFVGIEETQGMLDRLERAFPALVKNVVPKPLPLPLLAEVLRRLADEGISVRPLREILEALAQHAVVEREPVALTELVRAQLRRHTSHRHAPSGYLRAHLLDPQIEDAVRDAIQRLPTGSFLALEPELARDIVETAVRLIGRDPAVLLTQPDVRRYVRRLLEVDLPDLTVLSYQELAPDIHVEPLERIAM